MAISIFGICGACKKVKFFTMHRRYKPSGPPFVPLTSERKLCGRCFNNVKKALKPRDE